MSSAMVLFLGIVSAASALLFGGFAVWTAVRIFASLRDRGGIHTVWSFRTCAGMTVIGLICAVFCVYFILQTAKMFLSERPVYQVFVDLENRPVLSFVFGVCFGILLSIVFVKLRKRSVNISDHDQEENKNENTGQYQRE